MKKLIIPFALLALALASCTKKTEDVVDARDQMVGTYVGSYKVKLYRSKADSSLADTTITDKDTVTIAKSASVSDGIVITEKGNPEVSYNGSGVIGASNGAGFNIMKQTISIKGTGQTASITGTTTYTLGSLKYDGAFESTSKALNYQYGGTLNLTVNGASKTVPFDLTNTLLKK